MKTRVSFPSRRGAALITTLLFTFLLLALSGAILSWSTVESRINKAHKARLTARNAAEALIEYGATQASLQVHRVTEFDAAFCSPAVTSNRLNLPPADFFAGTNIDPATVEIVGKVTAPPVSGGVTFENNDPRNTNTLLRGMLGKRGQITLLSRASTFPNAFGQRQSIFVKKTMTVLDGPVLQYAAFYNTDLEIAPGPDLNIYGPVHTNRDLWLTKQGGATSLMKFWSNVSVVGKLRWGFKVQPITATGGRESAISTNYHIQFKNPAGVFTDLYGGWAGNSKWRDQVNLSAADFVTFTAQTYGSSTLPSSLQTDAHAVAVRRLPGQLDNYVPETDPTDSTIDAGYRNVPRALIERPLFSGDIEYIGEEVEKQKMSRKAGLYIIVNASNITRAARTPAGTSIGNLAAGEYRAYARTGPTTYTEVKLPGQPTHTWVVANGGTTAAPVRPVILVRPNQMTDMRRFRTFNFRNARSGTNTYDPKRLNLIEVDMTALKMAVDYTVNNQTTSMIFPYDTEWGGTLAISNNTDARYRSTYRAIYDGTTNHFGVNSGGRVGNPTLDSRYLIEGMSTTDWDGSIYIESLDADFINEAWPATATADVNGTAADSLPGMTGINWTTPNPANGATATGWLRRKPGHRSSGVRLINGRGPIVSANATRLANTSDPCSPGLTLSTNDAIYVMGHLNADGRIYSPSAAPTAAQLRDENVTDDSSNGNNSSLFRDPIIRTGATLEQPLALVGDAITILSHPVFDTAGRQTAGWNDSLSHLITDVALLNSNPTTPDNWLTGWATTAPSGDNAKDGAYNQPSASTKKKVFLTASSSTRSPLERYRPGTDTAPFDEVNADSSNTQYPAVHTKFAGAPTEVSAGFIIGVTPSANNPSDTTFSSSTSDGSNSGGLHNLPRFLEYWNSTCAIRGSMVVMFESKVGWEQFSLRVYGPPTRLWGFHNFFGNYKFSDDIPATRLIDSTFLDKTELISRAQYITERTAAWPSESFPTPP